MTSSSALTPVLEGEHQDIRRELEAFRHALEEGRVERPSLEAMARILHRHMYLEEELLFPRILPRGMAAPVSVMWEEHGRICELLAQVQRLAQEGAPASQVREALAPFLEIMAQHEAKEEQVLYPSSDRVLPEEERRGLLQEMARAQPPPGWTCQAHRQPS